MYVNIFDYSEGSNKEYEATAHVSIEEAMESLNEEAFERGLVVPANYVHTLYYEEGAAHVVDLREQISSFMQHNEEIKRHEIEEQESYLRNVL